MRHVKRAAALAAFIVTLPAVIPGALSAQGIGVNTQSACASGRNEAVTGDPCADGSAVFYNPAALAFEPSVLSVGASIVHNSNSYTPDAAPSVTYKRGPSNPLVPNAYLSWRGGSRWAVGIGVLAPYGLTIKWDTTFPGRFGGYDNTVKALYLQPTVAYQLIPDRLAVGAGFDVVMGTVDIRMREDLATQQLQPGVTFANLGIPMGTDFADLRLKGNATGYAGHFAVLLKATDRLSIGARYLMGTKVDFSNGTATARQVNTGIVLPAGNPITQGPPLPLDQLLGAEFQPGSPLAPSQKISTTFTYPAMALVGVAFKALPTVELFGDWQWTQWAKWDSVAVQFAPPTDTVMEIYLVNQNTNTFRLGAEWAALPTLDLRAGWGYNGPAETAIAVSPLLPEGTRNYVSGGLSYHLTRAFAVDAFVQQVIQQDRRGRLYPLTADQVRADNPAQVNTGLYKTNATVFGATLRYTFGHARLADRPGATD